MLYYKKETVLDAALNRIRYLFDEFPVIIVSMERPLVAPKSNAKNDLFFISFLKVRVITIFTSFF